MTVNNNFEWKDLFLKLIFIYKALCSSVCHVLFVPGGQTICLSPRGTNISCTQERGGQTFLTHRRGGDKHFSHTVGRGGQTFFVGGGGDHDDVDEEMDVS